MYGTPPNVVIVGTRLPSAMPIADRKSAGVTSVPKIGPAPDAAVDEQALLELALANDGGHLAACLGYSISERPVSRRKTSSRLLRRTSTSPAAGRARGRQPLTSLAVVGVQQHAIGQPLDSLGHSVELAVERLLHAGREAQLEHLARRILLDQIERGEPSATIFALSMTTRRSHSCSASSM